MHMPRTTAVAVCAFLVLFLGGAPSFPPHHAGVTLAHAKDWSGTGGAGKGLKDEDIKDPATGAPIDFNHTDYASPVRPDSLEYDRCKVTHRCNRAIAHYDAVEARYNFTKQIFPAGVQDAADLFLDFENWQSGTAGLFFDQAYLDRLDNTTVGGHFNSFDYDLIGGLYLNHTSRLVFNTTDVTMQFWAPACDMFEFVRVTAPNANQTHRPSPPSEFSELNERNESFCFQWDGDLVVTDGGTQIALFNFEHFYVGPVIDVVLTGVRALALVSRSSLNLDTMLTAPPGELGVRRELRCLLLLLCVCVHHDRSRRLVFVCCVHDAHTHRGLKVATWCRRTVPTSTVLEVGTSVCICTPSPPVPRTWMRCRKSLRPRKQVKQWAARSACHTRVTSHIPLLMMPRLHKYVHACTSSCLCFFCAVLVVLFFDGGAPRGCVPGQCVGSVYVPTPHAPNALTPLPPRVSSRPTDEAAYRVVAEVGGHGACQS